MVVAIDPRVELFGIGDSLREARLRQGLDLATIEAATCIRAHNLDLIEQERWDALPGDVYTAGFIRTYAAFLGLDADRYVELFKDSRALEREPIYHEAVQAVERAPRRAVAVVALLVLAGIAAAVFLLRGGGAESPATTTAPAPAAGKPRAKPPADVLHGPLVLRATGGDSWLVVRFGSSKGRLVWQGTLRRGNQLRFGFDKPLFVGFGKPEAVTVRAGTTRIRLREGRSLFVFSRGGVRVVRG